MKIFIFVTFSLFSAITYGEEDCFKAPSTIERSQCHDRQLKALDVELNTEYKDAIDELKQPYAKVSEEDFRAAQRLWVKFIDQDCLVKSKLYGGAGVWQNIEYLQCKEKYYKKRILLFKVASGKVAS